MAVTNHSGFEGIVTAGGTDRDVDKWNLTETTQEASSTTTADYNATDQRAWTRVQKGATTIEGSFEFPYNSLKEPYPSMRSGTEVAVTLTNGTTTWSGTAFVKSYAEDSGGVENGLFKCTVSFRNQGRWTRT